MSFINKKKKLLNLKFSNSYIYIYKYIYILFLYDALHSLTIYVTNINTLYTASAVFVFVDVNVMKRRILRLIL